MKRIATIIALLWLWPTPGQAERWYELNVHGHRIYATTETTEFALAVSRAVAAAAAPIDGRYGYDPNDTTVWVMHDDRELFNGAAYTQLNRIELYGTTADFQLRGFAPWVENVVAHEYAHLATISLARRYPRWLGGIVLGGVESVTRRPQNVNKTKLGVSAFIPSERVPRWFSEGIAQYESEREGFDSWDTTRRTLERAAFLSEQIYSVAEMGSVADKGWFGGEQVYNQGYSWSRYLADRFGPEALRRLLTVESGQAFAGFSRALEKTYGMPVSALEQGWKRAVETRVQQDLQALGTVTDPAMYFSDGGPFTQQPVLSPDGRQIGFFSDGEVDFPRNRLIIAPVTTPEQQTATTGRLQGPVAWSPDGSYVVGAKVRQHVRPARETYDLLKINIADGDSEWLTSRTRVQGPAFHPTGTTIYVSQRGPGSWDLATYSLATSRVTRLTHLPWGWQIRELSVGADGSLWGTLIHGGEVDIARFNPQQPNRVEILELPGSEEHSPKLDTRGRLWFSGDRIGSFQLYVLDLSNATIHRRTSVTGAALHPAPGVTETVFTLYTHHRYQLARIPGSGPTYGAPVSAGWRKLTLPTRAPTDTPALTDQGFQPAKFRLGRPMVYPEFQYQFGEPLAGAVAVLQDELGHHSLELEGLFGQSADIDISYSYTGFEPRLTLTGRRFMNDLGLGIHIPFAWDSIDASVLYPFKRRWLVGGGVDYTRIHYNDEIEILQVGGPFRRLQRWGGNAFLQWADVPGRTRNDIDPRGTILFLDTAVARSDAKPLNVDPTTGLLTLPHNEYVYGRLLGDLFWADGRGVFTGELGLRVGWIHRDVDPIDEFFLGGNIFSLRRGEFRSFSNLPGYNDFAVSGEKMMLARAAGRVMLATDMGGFGPFLFDALLLEVAIEGGNAWPDGVGFSEIIGSWFDGAGVAEGPRPSDPNLGIPADSRDFSGLLFDTVVDLRLKMLLYDFVNWNSFVRVAHGFQDGTFDPSTGQFVNNARLPVRIYVGIGTGF